MEQKKLPNATAVLVLGILSIVTCCCYGLVGLILGIVALVLAKKDMALYREAPEQYTNYSNLNTGRILAIIGVCLNALYVVYVIFLLATVGISGLSEMNQQWMQQIN